MRFLPVLFLSLVASAALAAEVPTLMTIRGRLLASEDFTKPLAPFTGKPVGFASGFLGWRYNAGPESGKSGRWEINEGQFRGIENPEAHHPATASFGFDFKDAIIQCDVRLNDVPAEGRKYRYLQLKATDTKDYVCVVTFSEGGLSGKPFDDARINSATNQRMEGPAVRVSAPAKLGEWHTVVLEIKGAEAVGTLDGASLTFSDPLIGADKHSIMLVAGTEASFRNFRVWEALPNPDWPKNRQAILASQPAAK